MNVKWRILSASLAASLVLSACGTSGTDDNEDKNGTGSAVEEPVDNPETETDIEESDSDAVSGDDEQADDAVDPADTDEDLLADAVETKSDEQDYSMKVLPGYTLTSEEPGRDSLYLDEDGKIFMRIETMPKDETYTFDELYTNLEELLEASSDGEMPVEVTDEANLPQHDDFKQVKGAEVDSDEGYFKGYVMEREDKLIRVTIYANEKDEHVEELTQMASTIH